MSFQKGDLVVWKNEVFKPAKDFPYNQAMSLYDCFDCEFDSTPSVSMPTASRGNIEQNFIEDWILDLEDDIELL